MPLEEGQHVGYIYGLFDSSKPLHLWECRYIGLTRQTLARRTSDHRMGRGAGRHQRNWVKAVQRSGATIILQVFETHATDDVDSLIAILQSRECIWVAEGWRQGWELTNQTEGGAGATGYYHSEESRAKISAAGTGRKHTPETRAKMSASRMGHPSYTAGLKSSDETKAKISESLLGNTRRAGKKQPPEERAKRSASMIGHVVTNSTKEKIRIANTGKKRTPEQVERNRQAQTGKTLSPEHRANIGAGVRLATQKKREQDV